MPNEADTCRRYVVPKLQAACWENEPHRINEQVARTIVFCVDQEHADEMRRALNNLNADLVRQHPDYVCRVVSDEGRLGRGHLSRFQDVERATPVIPTTSQMLTTGVDVPTCKSVVLLRVADYTAQQVRTLYTSAADLRDAWADPEDRAAVIAALEERGIDFDHLAEAANQPDADPFDLLCHIAFNAPLRTRRERARRLRTDRKDFWDQYSPEARAILDELLERYAAHGAAQFKMPDVLEVPPINEHGSVIEIAQKFGGEENLVTAVRHLQTLLY